MASQFLQEITVENGVKRLTKVQVDTSSLSLILPAGVLVRGGEHINEAAFINPCWLSLIPWLSCMCCVMALKSICFLALLGTELRAVVPQILLPAILIDGCLYLLTSTKLGPPCWARTTDKWWRVAWPALPSAPPSSSMDLCVSAQCLVPLDYGDFIFLPVPVFQLKGLRTSGPLKTILKMVLSTSTLSFVTVDT